MGILDRLCLWLLNRAIAADSASRAPRIYPMKVEIVGSAGTVGFCPRIPRGSDDD